jgi:hypothetical protein
MRSDGCGYGAGVTSGAEEKRPVRRSTMRRGSSLAEPRALLGTGALILAGVVGVVIWLLIRGGGTSETGLAHAASLRELAALPEIVHHPVYWAGPRPGTTYELSRTKDGRIYIRYLPPTVDVGTAKPSYLTVGTYPQPHAFATLRATAKRQGSRTVTLPGGGLAFQYRSRPTSVYLAYPGSNYQVEVFDPSSARALQLVSSGQVKPVGMPPQTSQGARAVTLQQLKDRAISFGHPLYWAGPESGYRYELTQTKDGSVFVRYLPEGAQVGDRKPDYLTVGTYPQKGALAILKATARRNRAATIPLANGGVAFVDPKHSTSVYLAYPSIDLQVEVYDPSPERARHLVASGQIAPIR